MKIKNIEHITLSQEWATLHRIEFDYKFKTGEWRRLSRETYNRGDGAAILLYNLEKKTVILTKQFRMPIYECNPGEAYSLEVCAGAVDAGESPLQTILREVEEETGYSINTARQVMSAYTSPGALTEKMFLFIAEYGLHLKSGQGGGSKEENEELEVMELSFDRALEMISTEEIRDAKTILLLQHAQINKLFQSNS